MIAAIDQQIKSLLQSYSEADSEQFISVALQIAAHEARSGRAKMATELKRLIDEIRHEDDPQNPFVKDEIARRASL